MGLPHLIKKGDVEGEPEAVLERNLVGQRIAQLPGGGRRVSQQGLGGPVHECHGQHDGLLGFGGLRVTKEGVLGGPSTEVSFLGTVPSSLVPEGLHSYP